MENRRILGMAIYGGVLLAGVGEDPEVVEAEVADEVDHLPHLVLRPPGRAHDEGRPQGEAGDRVPHVPEEVLRLRPAGTLGLLGLGLLALVGTRRPQGSGPGR